MATGFRVSTNASAMKTYRAFSAAQSKLEQSIERLSSGLRINKSSDDTEGAATVTRLSNRVRGLQHARKNSKQSVDMLQTAESALNDIHGILARMRELSVQAASDNVNTNDRYTLNMEYQQLKAEVNRIAQATEYNEIKLINGSQKAVINATKAGVGIDSIVSAGHGGQEVVSGTYTFESSQPSSLKLINQNTGETEIIDFTQPGAGEVKTHQFSNLGISITFNENFNPANLTDLSFDATTTGGVIQIGADDSDDSKLSYSIADATIKGLLIDHTAIDTLADAQSTINALDNAIDVINDDRSYIGSIQNRLEFSALNAASSVENLQASISTIRDVDYALEAMELAKYQILVQSGSAMMVQANQLSQTVLSLMQQ
jgi:flagellin